MREEKFQECVSNLSGEYSFAKIVLLDFKNRQQIHFADLSSCSILTITDIRLSNDFFIKIIINRNPMYIDR